MLLGSLLYYSALSRSRRTQHGRQTMDEFINIILFPVHILSGTRSLSSKWYQNWCPRIKKVAKLKSWGSVYDASLCKSLILVSLMDPGIDSICAWRFSYKFHGLKAPFHHHWNYIHIDHIKGCLGSCKNFSIYHINKQISSYNLRSQTLINYHYHIEKPLYRYFDHS